MIYTQRTVPPEHANKNEGGRLFDILGEVKIVETVVSNSLHLQGSSGAPRYSDNDLRLLIARMAVAKEQLCEQLNRKIGMLKKILGDDPAKEEQLDGFHPDVDNAHVRQIAKILLAQACIPDCDCDCPCNCLVIEEVAVTVDGIQVRTRNGVYTMKTHKVMVVKSEEPA